MKIFYSLTFFAFLLIGCARGPQAMVKPTETLKTIIIPTTTTIDSTTTPEPTTMVFKAEKPTQTPIPTRTLTVQQDVAAKLVGPCFFRDTLNNNSSNPIATSPKGKWIMFACESEKQEDGIVSKFVNLDDSKIWTISFNDLYIKPYNKNIPSIDADMRDRMFYAQEWTTNEDFVYLTVDFRPGWPYEPFWAAHGLFRLDLTTGKVSPQLTPSSEFSTPKFYNYKFSPSKINLAYIDNSVSPLTVVVENLITGNEKKFELDAQFTAGGHMLWSLNEDFLVVSLKGENAQYESEAALILFDLKKKKYETLIQEPGDVYLPDLWADENTFIVEDGFNTYYINILTKQVEHTPAP